MRRIIIAAPSSGSGKTTVTLGIMAALKRRGLVVAPFKVGPDFIDPGWHQVVTGRHSTNLDGWICSDLFIHGTFNTKTLGSDIAVVEGVMGLFDGINGTSDAGSTAQIAKILGASVILVVDAKSQARSVAAVVLGFACFDPDVRVSGVIFNNVGSENHGRVLKEAVESSVPGVRVVGCIPRDETLSIPSRHLGLVTAQEKIYSDEFHGRLAEVIGRHIDLEAILALGAYEPDSGRGIIPSAEVPSEGIRIAVARDEAFCFVYDDNLRLLREAGTEIVEFSPLRDRALTDGIHGIYLPGGYPEMHAEALASNGSMKDAVKDAVEKGMPVYAECGGFMYLTKGMMDHPFVGVFPVATRMLPRRKALGYREVRLLSESCIGTRGATARGHEFHYSEIEEMPEQIERVYEVTRDGSNLGREGYRYKNCLASYIHLHFGSNLNIANSFVESCRKFKKQLNVPAHDVAELRIT